MIFVFGDDEKENNRENKIGSFDLLVVFFVGVVVVVKKYIFFGEGEKKNCETLLYYKQKK